MSNEELITNAKEQYIVRINEMLKECADLPMLDLICKLLNKSL